jgi:hypothetical protein
MIVGIVAGVIALIVVFVVLGRMQNARKKEAIADLAREREALHTPDILELVHEEVAEAGLGDLSGAEGLDPTVLLKVWKRDGYGCPPGQGRYVLSDDIAPEEATEDSVTFEWSQAEADTANDA